MPGPYCYEYPRPAVTVDMAVFGLESGELKLLFIRRKHDPFAGRWALPGGFINIDEPVEAAARRELKEETGLGHEAPIGFFGVFADPRRDPRGRTISLAFGAAVRAPLPDVAGGDDARDAAWLQPQQATNLAFDHDKIVQQALGWLRREVEAGPIGLALLPPRFGRDDVSTLFREVLGNARGAAGWLRRQKRSGQVVTDPRDESRFRSTAQVGNTKA